jgi:hypothetical protein
VPKCFSNIDKVPEKIGSPFAVGPSLERLLKSAKDLPYSSLMHFLTVFKEESENLQRFLNET